MTKQVQTVITRHFVVGHVALEIECFPRAINSSHRINAKVLRYNFDDCRVNIKLAAFKDGHFLHGVDATDLADDDYRAETRWEIIQLASALGASGCGTDLANEIDSIIAECKAAP
jgi:hypothetical protein